MPTERLTAGSAIHLDRVTLADLDEGLLEAAVAGAARLHLAGCPECRERLASVTAVRAALAGAPTEPLPASVGARLDAALKTANRSAPATLGPASTPTATRRRWRPSGGVLATGAAASIALLLFGALVTGALKGNSNGSANHTGAAVGATGTGVGTVVASGRNYTVATLAAAVPELVAGRSRAAQVTPGPSPRSADSSRKDAAAPGVSPPVARTLADLGRPDRLAPCVAGLAGRSGVKPLAVDLARFAGKPAAVIVLPESGQPSIQDVWVVGPGCTRADPQLLYFTRLVPAGIRSP